MKRILLHLAIALEESLRMTQSYLHGGDVALSDLQATFDEFDTYKKMLPRLSLWLSRVILRQPTISGIFASPFAKPLFMLQSQDMYEKALSDPHSALRIPHF